MENKILETSSALHFCDYKIDELKGKIVSMNVGSSRTKNEVRETDEYRYIDYKHKEWVERKGKLEDIMENEINLFISKNTIK